MYFAQQVYIMSFLDLYFGDIINVPYLVFLKLRRLISNTKAFCENHTKYKLKNALYGV